MCDRLGNRDTDKTSDAQTGGLCKRLSTPCGNRINSATTTAIDAENIDVNQRILRCIDVTANIGFDIVNCFRGWRETGYRRGTSYTEIGQLRVSKRIAICCQVDVDYTQISAVADVGASSTAGNCGRLVDTDGNAERAATTFSACNCIDITERSNVQSIVAISHSHHRVRITGRGDAIGGADVGFNNTDSLRHRLEILSGTTKRNSNRLRCCLRFVNNPVAAQFASADVQCTGKQVDTVSYKSRSLAAYRRSRLINANRY